MSKGTLPARARLYPGTLTLIVLLGWFAPPAPGTPPRLPAPASGQTPAVRPYAIVHNPLAGDLPGTTSRYVRRATSPERFAQQQARGAQTPSYVGSLLIQVAGPNQPTWVAPPGGQVHVRATVHDLAAVQTWARDGITPGYLNQVEVDEIADGETALEVEVYQRLPNGLSYVRFRIRAADGACTLQEARLDGDIVAVQAGPWWPVCCGSQWLLCELSRALSPNACGSCYEACLLRCLSSGSDPCHSCGDCGLSSFLCRFVPGGRC